jgi:tetratricopeptide (TPR) repeat protein
MRQIVEDNMKIIFSFVAAACVVVGVGVHLARTKAARDAQSEQLAQPPPGRTNQPAETPTVVATPSRPTPRVRKSSPTPAVAQTAANSQAAPNFDDAAVFSQVIDSLVSPQTAYADKQALWKQLKEAGRFGQAIAALEQRTADNSGSADNAATLGEAYLKQCGMTNDMRQQAIFAMKADQAFENALNLDSSNWDARFYRAVSMSYWPANLNKSQEVIDNFQTLIQQQESQPPQPQFVLPYVWLGDQYQKAGNAETAAQVWQRGVALFPDNTELKSRMAGQH